MNKHKIKVKDPIVECIKRMDERAIKTCRLIILNSERQEIMTKKETIKTKLDAMFYEHADKCHKANKRKDLDSSTYELGYVNAIKDVIEFLWMEEVL